MPDRKSGGDPIAQPVGSVTQHRNIQHLLLTAPHVRTMGGRSTRVFKRLIVTKAELGTKRLCPNCGAKYYDLNKDPIVCPRCGTAFEVSTPPKARPQTASAEPKKEEPKEEAEAEAPAAEFVSLEEADEETADSGAVEIDLGDDEEEIEDDSDDDDTFLADDEDEDGDDVTDIIGDVDEDET